MDDVVKVLNSMKSELTILGVALAVAVVITIALAFVKAMKKPVRKLVRGNTWLAFVLVAVIVVNLIMTGPMYSMLNLSTGRGSISAKSIEQAYAYEVRNLFFHSISGPPSLLRGGRLTPNLSGCEG